MKCKSHDPAIGLPSLENDKLGCCPFKNEPSCQYADTCNVPGKEMEEKFIALRMLAKGDEKLTVWDHAVVIREGDDWYEMAHTMDGARAYAEAEKPCGKFCGNMWVYVPVAVFDDHTRKWAQSPNTASGCGNGLG